MLDNGTLASGPISVDEKRKALEHVLASRTFNGSDQLSNLLRYICEAEFEGRAHELNEYALGVSVLGLNPDYSPAEDPCVRSCANELRNKLKSYYRLEGAEDPIEIEVQKGACVPCFLRRQVDPAQAGAAELATNAAESTEEAASVAEKRYVPLLLSAVAVLAVAVVSLSLYIFHTSRKQAVQAEAARQGLSPEVALLWKPFLGDDAPLLVSFDVRPFFFAPSTGLVVRDYQINSTEELPRSRPLAEFQKRMATSDLREVADYSDLGAVHAVFLLERLLAPQGRDILLKHSRSLGWEDIWNNNIIFIGKPNLNPGIQYVLKGGDFVVDEFGVIRNPSAKKGELAEYRSAETHGVGKKYALITVLPGPQPGRHIMILSGSGSELMWALAECVTNPVYVREMVSHLKRPSGKLPDTYQVVIEATFEANVPVRIRYVTHRIFKAS
jgi:hypothetical protein